MAKRNSLRSWTLERLESRFLCAADWQNSLNAFDVNNSGDVEPLDALIVINDLNTHGVIHFDARPDTYTGPLCDVSGDGMMTTLDALLVLNQLNRSSIGASAPAVALPNQDGQTIDLGEHLGKEMVVLYFYPKDNTPGCTVEANDFSSRKTQIEELGAKIYGVSLDSVGSHQQFADQHKLSFDILSDVDGKVTLSYGALKHINGSPIAKRMTFIIGKDGDIKEIFDDVNVATHGAEVIESLQRLNTESANS